MTSSRLFTKLLANFVLVHRRTSQSTAYHAHVAPLCMLFAAAVASVSSIVHPLPNISMLELGYTVILLKSGLPSL